MARRSLSSNKNTHNMKRKYIKPKSRQALVDCQCQIMQGSNYLENESDADPGAKFRRKLMGFDDYYDDEDDED